MTSLMDSKKSKYLLNFFKDIIEISALNILFEKKSKGDAKNVIIFLSFFSNSIL